MMIVASIIIAILLWSMSEVAWEEGRQKMAWTYLFLSALNGALVMSAIF
jgi:uncharacterized membrane protein